ncbi:MAG TPA: hypothetical protein VK195_17490 [Burkholderiaceae bacterium]|nr:hypothetical protein [Burkholderiaceae bacterium]
MPTQKPSLAFHAIDLDRHAALCVEFRADSYACGDGDARRFWATAGHDAGDQGQVLTPQ